MKLQEELMIEYLDIVDEEGNPTGEIVERKKLMLKASDTELLMVKEANSI